MFLRPQKVSPFSCYLNSLKLYTFRICQETLTLIIFEGMFGFDIDRTLISTISYFVSFFLLACELCKSGIEIIHGVSNMVRNTNIAFIGLHCDMCLNWGNIYVWGRLVWPFMESAVPSNWYFLAFFAWPVNCSSLIYKLLILFWTFREMWTGLKYYRIFRTVLYRKINFNW